LNIYNRDEPFEEPDSQNEDSQKNSGYMAQNIVYDFKPPNK
jgi:hypothetical protein